jgi:hypothetical protein
MKKPIAEFIGTFTLVFFGCGAAVIAGMGTGPTAIDVLGIAFAFGLAIVAMAYGIGPVSGCHVNPAVSLGVLVAGRMTTTDFVSYVIAQVLGAIAGAIVLSIILSGKSSGWSGGLGRDPYCRDQRHGRLGQSGALARPGDRRRGSQSRRTWTGVAVHRRTADRRGDRRFSIQTRWHSLR